MSEADGSSHHCRHSMTTLSIDEIDDPESRPVNSAATGSPSRTGIRFDRGWEPDRM